MLDRKLSKLPGRQRTDKSKLSIHSYAGNRLDDLPPEPEKPVYPHACGELNDEAWRFEIRTLMNRIWPSHEKRSLELYGLFCAIFGIGFYLPSAETSASYRVPSLALENIAQ
ncbi:hypothetical protein [Chromohalobacter sp. 48-RD10]|uniref:hypothetical protein n=1 Tax=Chromohalobacter sp. 48-RD10 TaxID=2994063 RepID=UPI00246992AD|nr:hypothetical protein [Chromohalobacter sp. 48-RD10]